MLSYNLHRAHTSAFLFQLLLCNLFGCCLQFLVPMDDPCIAFSPHLFLAWTASVGALIHSWPLTSFETLSLAVLRAQCPLPLISVTDVICTIYQAGPPLSYTETGFWPSWSNAYLSCWRTGRSLPFLWLLLNSTCGGLGSGSWKTC